ncbi:P-loop NTPase family protein [Dawidia soli]|uniref:ATPase n=1 Tax=Dawidia soli TaxID=2782352 RepID=A0AAP2GJB3_9BACT|nr:ATPase [Dawidia soli]MBT1689226.1 ATPase [Dawidia soli]
MDKFDFNWCLAYFQKHGRALFGPRFTIHPGDHAILYKLVVYFIRHQAEADRLGIDLRKGILLTGPVGCGKSSLMTLMRTVPMPPYQFTVRSCREVGFEFREEGYGVIGRYSKLSYRGAAPRAYCFDDLGAEQNLKYFGNECNVLAEILLSRYDRFVSEGMVTHITTNLSAEEIEQHYGKRVRSRLREQMNLVAFSRRCGDKRG